MAIMGAAGYPDDWQVSDLLTNRATALTALGRYDEAERDFAAGFRLHPRETSPPGMQLGDQLHGYGALRLAQGRPGDAIPMLDEALAIREHANRDATFTADTRFALARALSLATAARDAYAKHQRPREETSVATWLGTFNTSAR